jgi:hypothetical protein
MTSEQLTTREDKLIQRAWDLTGELFPKPHTAITGLQILSAGVAMCQVLLRGPEAPEIVYQLEADQIEDFAISHAVKRALNIERAVEEIGES